MKKFSLSFLLAVVALGLSAQSSISTLKASADSLRKHVSILASDAFEGRNTGEKGQKLAAEYIATHFKALGLTPIDPKSSTPYYQKFDIIRIPFAFDNAILSFKDTTNRQDLSFFSDAMPLSGGTLADTNITPYLGVPTLPNDSSICAPVITARTIAEGLAKVEQAYKEKKDATNVCFLALPSDNLIAFHQSRFVLTATLLKKTTQGGDTLLFTPMITPFLAKENEYYSKMLPFLSQHPGLTIFLTDEIFLKKLFDSSSIEGFPDVKSSSVGKTLKLEGEVHADKIEKTATENVIGMIKGTSKTNDVVVICAHYDHIGIIPAEQDSICNGADDNASGTSAVLEAARLFAKAKQKGLSTKRNIIFAAFTGEELGLLGSEMMVSKPVIPIRNIKGVVNLDMIGRTNFSHKKKDMYAYPLLLGDTCSTKKEMLKQCAKMAQLNINSPISDREESLWTNGSDHDSFVKVGVPAIVITTGEHQDYHTPADEASKLIYPRMERIASFAFYTTWMLANME